VKTDALVAEIGSTTTILSAFDKLESEQPVFLGQGSAPTTVLEGDVTIGLETAMKDLAANLGTAFIEPKETFACSSAAGGLKMSVHGLVYDMTVKAAREAALGAGANLKLITAGIIDEFQLEEIKNLKLNIIMIAGGVDFGETRTSLENARIIAALKLGIPVIYAGNVQNHSAVKKAFVDSGQSELLFITKNVYPKIDTLETESARKIIQQVFEKHIILAPGMEKVRNLIHDDIIPTPGAVMEAAIRLQPELGDLVAFDVGGATTDIHSVTKGSQLVEKMLVGPEPFAKRTVEGDLGVYINKDNIVAMIGKVKLASILGIGSDDLERLLTDYPPIPDPEHIPLVERLTEAALSTALERHAGHFIHLFGPSGKMTLAEGKDLTEVKYVIATGGALTRLPGKQAIIKSALKRTNNLLLKPHPDTKILIDEHYIMAALGVLAKKHPEAALSLLKNSLEIR